MPGMGMGHVQGQHIAGVLARGNLAVTRHLEDFDLHEEVILAVVHYEDFRLMDLVCRNHAVFFKIGVKSASAGKIEIVPPVCTLIGALARISMLANL
jgi:hypothetical protein